MRFRLFAAVGLLVSLPHLSFADRCQQALAHGIRIPITSLALLYRAIQKPGTVGVPYLYANSLDTTLPRHQAEANAIRLAIAIEREGGDDNPFDADVHDFREQNRRLSRHAKGPELFDLWKRAGWAPPRPPERNHFGSAWTGTLVRNGLPRVLQVHEAHRHGRGASRLRTYAGRLPSVTRIEEVRIHSHLPATPLWDAMAFELATRGHLGLGIGLRARAAESLGTLGPGFILPELETHVARWLAWLQGGEPRESDFFRLGAPAPDDTIYGGRGGMARWVREPALATIFFHWDGHPYAHHTVTQFLRLLAKRGLADPIGITIEIGRWIDSVTFESRRLSSAGDRERILRNLRRTLEASTDPNVRRAAQGYAWGFTPNRN